MKRYYHPTLYSHFCADARFCYSEAIKIQDQSISSNDSRGLRSLPIKREFIETIQDPNEAQKLIFDTIRSASEEIQIIFSASNTPYRYEHEAMLLNLLNEKILISPNISNNEIKIRIVIPQTSSLNKEKIQKLLLVRDDERIQEGSAISIKYLSRAHLGNNKLTTLIVDNEYAITVELKDSNKFTDQAVGLVLNRLEQYSLILAYFFCFSHCHELEIVRQLLGRSYSGQTWN